MALVVRINTWERIGYFADLNGPLPAGTYGCMFDAWRHPDGSLRHEPPLPFPTTAGSAGGPAQVRISIPVQDSAAGELELIVSPTYLDFITRHPTFHPFPPRPWRQGRWRLLTPKRSA
jgi:hypothetical protein